MWQSDSATEAYIALFFGFEEISNANCVCANVHFPVAVRDGGIAFLHCLGPDSVLYW